ncbi:outer envelope pore protein 24B, chloroplastic-like [Carex rostrata]
MKAVIKGKYEVSEKASLGSSLFTLSAAAGDLRFKATATNATFSPGPSLEGISLAVEKPGAFIVDVNVPKKDVRFQFMNMALVMNKPMNIMYMHSWGDNRTTIDCTTVFDPANKVSVSHSVGSRACRVKYAYAHGELRNTVFEPCYDTGKNTWDFALTRKLEGGNAVKGTYNCSSKLLGLEWSRDSKTDGTFKVSASIDMAEEKKSPKLMAERVWNYDLF